MLKLVIALGSIVGWEWMNKPEGESIWFAMSDLVKWLVIGGGLLLAFLLWKKKGRA